MSSHCASAARRHEGFTVYAGLRIEHNSSSDSLGEVFGDNSHCRRVCSVVPGCNLIVAEGPRCRLYAACMPQLREALGQGRVPATAESPAHCSETSIAMLAEQCSERPKWQRLAYRLPIEGNMLGTVAAQSAVRCREICDTVPGCNSFARQRAGRSEKDGVICHLKARCAAPGSPETRLDADDAPRESRAKLARLRGHFVSHYKWPCSSESVEFPLPGLRRSLPPIPSGLAALDCRGGAPSSASGGFIPGGGSAPYDRIRGYCERVRAPRPVVTQIRWPSFYQLPPGEVIEQPAQRAWQGADANRPLDGRAGGGGGGGGEEGAVLFDAVAREVARKSFNGKEVVLMTSNTDGLPLAVNLIANLAQFGHHHSLLLTDGPATCRQLTSASPPACLHSSLLKDHRRGLSRYVSNSVWVMWLQRYMYILRMVRLGLNTLLLDTDVILFHDPYPFFKGLMHNHTCIVLCDSSAGYAAVNGGIWYVQGAHPAGPVAHIFSEFQRRITALLTAFEEQEGGGGSSKAKKLGRSPAARQADAKVVGKERLVRFGPAAGHRQGQPADILMYDQVPTHTYACAHVHMCTCMCTCTHACTCPS